MRYWIGVAASDHVARGVEGGFCQLCHGKAAPLKRMSPGDWIAYYSPRTGMKGGETVQAFTALGRVADDTVFQHDMVQDFAPFRRRIDFVACQSAAIKPMLPNLSFIRKKESWGYVFRFGMIEIPEADFRVIAEAMAPNLDLTREAA
jgi:EVE domain